MVNLLAESVSEQLRVPSTAAAFDLKRARTGELAGAPVVLLLRQPHNPGSSVARCRLRSSTMPWLSERALRRSFARWLMVTQRGGTLAAVASW